MFVYIELYNLHVWRSNCSFFPATFCQLISFLFFYIHRVWSFFLTHRRRQKLTSKSIDTPNICMSCCVSCQQTTNSTTYPKCQPKWDSCRRDCRVRSQRSGRGGKPLVGPLLPKRLLPAHSQVVDFPLIETRCRDCGRWALLLGKRAQ